MVDRNNLRLTCSDDAVRSRHQPLAPSMSTSSTAGRWPDNDHMQSITFGRNFWKEWTSLLSDEAMRIMTVWNYVPSTPPGRTLHGYT